MLGCAILRCARCKQPLREPPPAYCPLCGSAVVAALEPSGLIESVEPPARTGIPWEDPSRHGGNLAALFQTIRLLVVEPRDFFSELPPQGNLVRALVFGVAAACFGFMSWLASVFLFAWLSSLADPNEKAAVVKGFASKKLGLGADAAGAAFDAVAERMKDAAAKHRVTFYYLLAEQSDTLKKLV